MAENRYTAYTPDENGYINYSEEEHSTWKTLYERQIKIIENRAAAYHATGLAKLNMAPDKIPQPRDVSEAMRQITGWTVEPVPALIDFDIFFDLLAHKKFPAASFIRRKEDLDYLMEPDIFHELFGHCPMLTEPNFAEFVREVGIFGKTLNRQDQTMLGRLFWFTVEFGLINDISGLRIYGAGILSSKSESVYALESDVPLKKPFDLIEVLRTPYRYDEMQKIYFVIDSYKNVFNLINGKLTQAFREAKELGMLPNLYTKNKDDEYRSC